MGDRWGGKIVVTGGAGFIGANLCRRLVAGGDIDEVVALDDLSTGNQSNLAGVGVKLVVGSILDSDALDEVFEGASAIVHLAARPSVPRSIDDPVTSHEVNATGTMRVLEAARRVDDVHVIVASSSSVYGANPVLPKREDLAPMPASPYAASKLATEVYTLAWARTYRLDTLAFRFFNVFGPLQPAGHAYAAVIPAFLAALQEGRPLAVHGDGAQTRDFTFVGSVCAVIADALRRRVVHATPVNLAFGSRVSLLDLIALLEQEMERSITVEHLPPRVGDVRHSQADGSLLRSLFPDIEPTDLVEGLQRTIAWFRGPPGGIGAERS